MRKIAFFVAAAICLGVVSCGTVTDDMNINSVSPTGGSTSGGNEVLLTGRGFVADSTVTFGGENAVVTSVESTKIKVIAPPSDSTGSVNITLTDPDGVETTKQNGYRYRSMLYVANKGSNQVAGFDFDDSTYELSQFSQSPTNADGSFPIGMAYDTSTSSMYVGHSATVSAFNYSFADGSLVSLASPFSAGATGVNELVFDSTNRILFTSNYGSSTVSSFTSDDETGLLTFVEVDGGDGLNPYDVAIDQGSKFLFLANYQSNDISVFRYDVHGVLTEVSNSPFGSEGQRPAAIAVDRENDILFCANFNSSSFAVFTYDDAGKLTYKGNQGSQGTYPRDIVLDIPRGLIFVANYGSGTIRSFTYQADGSVADTGFSAAVGGEKPRALAISTTDKTLFVANEQSSDLAVITYDSDGKMTVEQSGVAAGGFTPSGLIFIP